MRYCFNPFGSTLLDTFSLTRQGYIGKEKDVESSLGDHGVRKYDYETGRFNSVDPISNNNIFIINTSLIF